jgi:hypothetical protein
MRTGKRCMSETVLTQGGRGPATLMVRKTGISGGILACRNFSRQSEITAAQRRLLAATRGDGTAPILPKLPWE